MWIIALGCITACWAMLSLLTWRSQTGSVASASVEAATGMMGWSESVAKPYAAFLAWLSFSFTSCFVAIAIMGINDPQPLDWTGSARQWSSVPFWVLFWVCLVVSVLELLYMRPKLLLPDWLRDGAGLATLRRGTTRPSPRPAQPLSVTPPGSGSVELAIWIRDTAFVQGEHVDVYSPADVERVRDDLAQAAETGRPLAPVLDRIRLVRASFAQGYDSKVVDRWIDAIREVAGSVPN